MSGEFNNIPQTFVTNARRIYRHPDKDPHCSPLSPHLMLDKTTGSSPPQSLSMHPQHALYSHGGKTPMSRLVPSVCHPHFDIETRPAGVASVKMDGSSPCTEGKLLTRYASQNVLELLLLCSSSKQGVMSHLHNLRSPPSLVSCSIKELGRSGGVLGSSFVVGQLQDVDESSLHVRSVQS